MKLASIVLFAATMLAGCAASSTTGTAARTTTATGPSSFSGDGIDTWKMSQVNQTARARGVNVIWVNAPRRR